MKDLLEDKVSLAQFRGIAFVGGFRFVSTPTHGEDVQVHVLSTFCLITATVTPT
jgi:hypothetical protein